MQMTADCCKAQQTSTPTGEQEKPPCSLIAFLEGSTGLTLSRLQRSDSLIGQLGLTASKR